MEVYQVPAHPQGPEKILSQGSRGWCQADAQLIWRQGEPPAVRVWVSGLLQDHPELCGQLGHNIRTHTSTFKRLLGEPGPYQVWLKGSNYRAFVLRVW